MQRTEAIHGFSSLGIPAHGLSSLAWISTTRRLAGAGMCMARKQEHHAHGISLSFLRHHSARDWERAETSRRYVWEPITSCYWRPAPHRLTYKESFVSVAGSSLDCSCDDGHDRFWGKQVGHVLLRAALLAVACASFLLSKKMALAEAIAGPGLSPVPFLLQQSKDGLGLLWPKFLQVMGVFRDQGMLLTILLGLSAFFSMAETSITTLWPWKVRELAEKEAGDGVFHMLKQDVTRFLTTILIGTTVANIAATALVTDAATALFGEAGVTAATGVMTVVILLLTEITPKSIAVHNATEVARIVVRPVAWLSYVLYPVGRIVTAISMGLLKLLGLKSSGEPFVTEEELKLMLRGAELSGAIEEEEQDMIENVLEIKDTYVREVMTPLVDVVAIDSSATVMDFRNLWVTHQYSRVPVFERRVDNIVGIAYAMDMLDFVEQVEVLQKLTVGRIAHKPAYFVPDSMSVWNLLREFRIRKVHMAIVLNEYGGTVGLVTLEDVVEEIVGEIFDENDSKEEIRRKTGYIVQRADGVFDVDANTSIEDLTEALEVKAPEIPYHYETVSGFVCEAFGYIPRTGESIKVIMRNAEEEGSDRREGDSDSLDDRKEKYQKYRLEILAGNARKVGSVRFQRLHASEENISYTSRHHWEEKQDADYDNEDECNPSWDSDGDSEASLSEDEGESSARARNLIAESIDVDSITDSDALSTSGLPFLGDQECDLSLMTEKSKCSLESDGMDVSTATAVDTLYTKWEKHLGATERRRQRRRKHAVEATVELDRHRKFYVKRKEAETGVRIVQKQNKQEQ
eukprot:c20311_g1_i1 orf=694-3096(-)